MKSCKNNAKISKQFETDVRFCSTKIDRKRDEGLMSKMEASDYVKCGQLLDRRREVYLSMT
jgi:hypothetical protein